MRLILKSRKKNAWVFKERIIQLVSDFKKRGINWASLPKTYPYRGKDLTWSEYVAKMEALYFKKHPDATFEEFLASLPDR